MSERTSPAPAAGPPRHCFVLRVRPDRLDEYAARHLGDGGLLVGHVASENREAAQRAMAATEVDPRRQARMRDFFVGLDGAAPDEVRA